MPVSRAHLPVGQFAAAATLLIVASTVMFSSLVWTATAARDLEDVNEELLRLQSLSTSIHKLGETPDAAREVRAELDEMRRLALRRAGWQQWVAELAPIVDGRLAAKDDKLNEEIDRRLDALEEYELSLLETTRRQSRERGIATAALFAFIVALAILLLAGAFRTLRLEIAAHRETAEKFSKAFYGSSTPMAIIGALDGRLLEINRSLERLFGWPEGAAAGRLADELGLSVAGAGLCAALSRIGATGPLRDVEAELGPRSILVSADTLTLDGAPCYFACFYDITVRKRAEVALRDFSGALVRAEQKERRRLAQILHDNLQQTLAAAAMHINLVLSRRPEDARDSAASAAGILKEAVQTTRELSYELCPPGIARGSLGRSLRWLAGQMRSRHNLEVAVLVEHDPSELPESVRDFMFASARELLFNVVKHAKTPGAKLALSAPEGVLRLEVSDEGPGFDLTQVHAGMGLADMRERAGLFGGAVEIDSGTGRGSSVVLSVPAVPVPA